jgi:hypothetical protein
MMFNMCVNSCVAYVVATFGITIPNAEAIAIAAAAARLRAEVKKKKRDRSIDNREHVLSI